MGTFATLPPWRPPSWNEEDVGDKPRWIRDLRPSRFDKVFTDLMRRRAYDSLLAVDEQLGALLDHLAALGVARDTAIVFTSDNGATWGEHRLFHQGKGCPYEECLRVPMVVWYPPRTEAVAKTSEAAVLNIDVAPTLAELADVEVPPVDGRSFAGWLGGEAPRSWRTDYLIESWRMRRSSSVDYSAQVADGDQLRLFHGDPRARPRASTLFEFDAGDGVSAGATAVEIGASARASFAQLGRIVEATVPDTSSFLWQPGVDTLSIRDESPDHSGVYWWEERNQASAFTVAHPQPDFFGVRDVANGLVWVEHETGERELYDLNADPHQLENRADDPSYRSERERLEERLSDLLAGPGRSSHLVPVVLVVTALVAVIATWRLRSAT